MQVTAEHTKPREVELKIEIDAEQVNKTVQEVYREYARVTEVPGFRKGKAPLSLVERYVSPDSVKRRAIEKMMPAAYEEALKQEDIEPYADPDIEIIQFEKEQPFIFKASVPLPPIVELGEYKGIEVQREVAEVTDDDVEAELKRLQDSNARTEKVEGRGVSKGDYVLANIASAPEGEELGDARRSLIEVGSNLPEFDENILGLEADQRKTFTIQYPEDYGDDELKGKKFEFDVTIKEIRERKVPELNDEFAKSVGEYQTLDELKADIRKRLIEGTEKKANTEVVNKIIDEIVSRSKVEFPDIMVEHEVYHDLEDLQHNLDRYGITMDMYLRRAGITQDQLLEQLRERARSRITTGLVLGEIAEKENLSVSDEEIDGEIDRIAAESGAPRETVQAYLEAKGGKDSIVNQMLNQKIIDFLKSVSRIKE